MSGSLTIGDFARATHLSVKALRYYHSVGVLTPAAVDPVTGYRRYRTEQIAVARADAASHCHTQSSNVS